MAFETERGGVRYNVNDRSRMTINPRIPTMPGRSTSIFHRPGRGDNFHGLFSSAAWSYSLARAAYEHPISMQSSWVFMLVLGSLAIRAAVCFEELVYVYTRYLTGALRCAAPDTFFHVRILLSEVRNRLAREA